MKRNFEKDTASLPGGKVHRGFFRHKIDHIRTKDCLLVSDIVFIEQPNTVHKTCYETVVTEVIINLKANCIEMTYFR